MAKPPPRKLEVIRTQQLSPHLRRITFGGPCLEGFPENQESAYIKFVFSGDGSAETRMPSPETLASKSERPPLRPYTVRRHDVAALELDVDFALHGDAGPASRWAVNAETGDQIIATGPGGKKLLNFDADWFFLVGDITALPAICVNIEQMPRSARGYVVLEVPSAEDKLTLELPDAVELHWVIDPEAGKGSKSLLEKVRSLPFMEGQPSIWAACEFDSMRALREHFKLERSVKREHIYISSYWKLGLSEEEHKAVKKQDAQVTA